MNKPPIKQKPVLKPKPPAKPADLKGKLNNLKLNDEANHRLEAESNSLNPKPSDRLTERSVHNGKSSIFSDFDRLSQESTTTSEPDAYRPSASTFSQKVLDQGQLQKAFQLLNQSGLPEKEDVHYDIRVDEDQIETCQLIISALLEAGYFRANIVGLSEFDKVNLVNRFSIFQLVELSRRAPLRSDPIVCQIII